MSAPHGNSQARTATYAIVGVLTVGAVFALTSRVTDVGEPSPSPIRTVIPGSLVWLSGAVSAASGIPASGTILAFRDAVEPFADEPQGSTTLDAQGTWRFTLQAGDRYCLVLTASDEQTTPRPWGATETTLFFGPTGWTLVAAQRECFAVTSAAMRIDFVLPAGAPVSGTLTWRNGQALGSTGQQQVELMAMVDETHVSAATSVDEDGRFSMHLLPGTFSFSESTVAGRLSRLESGLGTITVGSGPVTGARLTVDGVPPAFTSLVGRVVDAAGAPAPAAISAFDVGADLSDYPAAVTWTDATGWWEMTVPSGSDYCLVAAPGEGRTLRPEPLPGYPKRVFFWSSGATTDQGESYCISTSGRTEFEINLVLPRI